jgi:putative DNA primase/helicase
MAAKNYSKALIRLAEGTSKSLGKVKNVTLSWGQLASRLNDPQRSGERVKEYQKMSVDERNKLKGANGWFLGGHCDDGRRKKSAIRERDVLTFDLDDSNVEQLEDLQMEISGISDYEWYAHTTRSHTAESPRLRIYVLLNKPIPADQYSAATRIFAQKLDPTLDTVDHVSYRIAQLMYLPTASKNGEFAFIHNKGQALNVADMLESFGDWEDFTKLPFSEKQGQQRPAADKAENPHEKDGIIGAFCRAYDVETAISEFLSDVYAPSAEQSNKPRYTYLGGSGANGVVVEDEGLFIYSHHGTDPCGERLCNAWDMVRLHKFADLDVESKADTSPGNMPSFKKMAEFAKDQPSVKKELMQDRYDILAMFKDVSAEDSYTPEDQDEQEAEDDSEDLGGTPTKGFEDERVPQKLKPPASDWYSTQLEIDVQGRIVPTLHNVAMIIQCDPRLWGCVALNEFTKKVVLRRSIKTRTPSVKNQICEDLANGTAWGDIHDDTVRAILEAPTEITTQGWGLKVSDRDLRSAANLAAEANLFHPIKEKFHGLEWDGKERLARLFIDYLGAEDHPYYRETATLICLASVARIYHPGHKFDFAPILSGAQGIRKSTFIAALFGDDLTGELSTRLSDMKTAVEQMFGKLCLELPELAAMQKSESEDTKHFMTIQVDRVRLAYARRVQEFPRQCVFMGTTNSTAYLKDRTGNRRWWPIAVQVNQIDTGRLAAESEQIWAEAVYLYWELRKKHGPSSLPLFMQDPESCEFALALQGEFREESKEESMAAEIDEWANTPQPLSLLLGEVTHGALAGSDEPMVVPVELCLAEVWEKALGQEPSRYLTGARNGNILAGAMRELKDWSRSPAKRPTRSHGRQRTYYRLDANGQERKQGHRIVDL